MEYEQIQEIIQNLSGAHVWLLLAVLVFAICAVLTVITFRQFNQHQDRFEDEKPSSVSAPEAILIDTSNSTGISRYTVSQKPVMIGRIEANDRDTYDSIVIPDVTVGRRHAVIEFDGGVFWLQDQGSVNGCFVNGHRIQERYRLRDGDYIKIHKFAFQFVERFVVGRDYAKSEIHSSSNTTMPQISPSFPVEPVMHPNDVLVNHGHQKEAIMDIPRLSREAESVSQRTQVLYDNELQKGFTNFEHNSPGQEIEQPEEQLQNNIQDMTVQLFVTPSDDKTERLYSSLLNHPPIKRPDYDEENNVFSQLSLLPDMDEKVQEALGDFFSDTQDDIDIHPLHEPANKSNILTRLGNFPPSPISRSHNEKKRKS